MVTAALQYPAAILASACLTSAAVSSRSLRAPMTFEDRLEDVLVLFDRLGGAAVEPGGEPVFGGLPDGVVYVACLRGDALVELLVQVA
jgi:hypothetical protein